MTVGHFGGRSEGLDVVATESGSHGQRQCGFCSNHDARDMRSFVVVASVSRTTIDVLPLLLVESQPCRMLIIMFLVFRVDESELPFFQRIKKGIN